LFEYVTNHPLLAGAAAILAVLTVVIEIRERARGSTVIAPGDAVRLVNAGALVLDVRDAGEYEAGHIIDARHIPAKEVGERAESLKKFREKPVVVCCESGMTSAGAASALRALGFNKVATLKGGLRSWRQENLPLIRGGAKKDGKA
ncbi:MAG TPA: rhodanese-like domain-containing protein, partial [Povalibacter sp.]|nr:rhodanese-like domain-containing protein [Povalibacter sp.]